VITQRKVDLGTLGVRQSRAIVQFLTWERILLKTGTEVTYPIWTNNAAGCPQTRNIHCGILEIGVTTALGAANRYRSRALLRIVEDEPPNAVRPLKEPAGMNAHADFIVPSHQRRLGIKHNRGILSGSPELAGAVGRQRFTWP
jgi:hypothetical protein